MKDSIRDVVLCSLLEEKYNSLFVKKYHDSHDQIDNNISEEIKVKYYNIAKKTAYFLHSNGFNNVFSANVAFEYLLWNGYFSHNKEFQFNPYTEKYNSRKIYGLDVVLGTGVCLNIADLQREVFYNMGFDAHIITCNMDDLEKVRYKPAIKRDMIENNIHYNKNSLLGNYVLTLVSGKYYNMIFDPSNLDVYYLNRNLNIKNYFGYERKNIKLIPESMLYLERMSRSDFYNHLEKLVYKHGMFNNPRRISNETLEKLDGMVLKLDEFYDQLKPDIDSIYYSLKPKEKSIRINGK